jgi:hypothetical protein
VCDTHNTGNFYKANLKAIKTNDIGYRGKTIDSNRFSVHFFFRIEFFLFLVVLMWCPGQNKRIIHHPFFHGRRKRRLKDIPFKPKIDRDQTEMGLPPVTSAVFLIAMYFR